MAASIPDHQLGLELQNFDDPADQTTQKIEFDMQRHDTPQQEDYFPPRRDESGTPKPRTVSTEQRKSYLTNGSTAPLTSASTPDLSHISTHLTPGERPSNHSRTSSGTEGDNDDDDEDIPLGILAAQGFPTKNKTAANRVNLSQTPPSLNRRGSMPLSTAAPSVSALASPGAHGSLPVFARNLPRDPYSANPGMGERQASVGTSPALGGLRPGQVHPSGLVGVIAGEEQARAMRRGSSTHHLNNDPYMSAAPSGGLYSNMAAGSSTMSVNALPNYGHPAMPNMGMVPPGAIPPGEQAQMQMVQQMNQMMQMQMHWMQQMQQMQQNGQMSPMQAQPPFPPPAGMMPAESQYFPNMAIPQGHGNFPELYNHQHHHSTNPGQARPSSMPLPEFSGPAGRSMNLNPESPAQRNRNSSYLPSMSTADLTNAGVGAHTFTPSLAPSERNTIRMASRYRPVSVAVDMTTAAPPPQDDRPAHTRASTFSAGMMSSSPNLLKPQASWVGGLKNSSNHSNGNNSNNDAPRRARNLSPHQYAATSTSPSRGGGGRSNGENGAAAGRRLSPAPSGSASASGSASHSAVSPRSSKSPTRDHTPSVSATASPTASLNQNDPRYDNNNNKKNNIQTTTTTTTTTTHLTRASKPESYDDDDDDDKGWAEMKRQRDRKRMVWQMKKRERIAIG